MSADVYLRRSARDLHVPSLFGVGIHCPVKAHHELMGKFRALGLG